MQIVPQAACASTSDDPDLKVFAVHPARYGCGSRGGLSNGKCCRATDLTTMSKQFAQMANYVAEASGSPVVFAAATLTVLLWLVTGPLLSYSNTWQLVMNTWTNVVTEDSEARSA